MSSLTNICRVVLVLAGISLVICRSHAGTDCNCAKTGSFIGANQGAGVEISQDSISPNGKYRVTVTGTGPFDIAVRRISDDSLRYTTNLSNGNWGFSPDEDRFIYHYDLTGVHNVVLIDLSVSPAQKTPLAAVTTSSSRILFTPFGDYVLYAALTSPTHTLLNIFEARTGIRVYNSEFDFQAVAGSGDTWGMVDWGFSPDSSSRTFVYAFGTGQSSVQWQMINLQSQAKVLDLTLTGISSFWKFSPCGDVLGIVEQTDLYFINVRLYKTISTQAPLYSQTLSFGDPIEFRTTASSHIIKVVTTDHIMSSNTASAVCTIEPISLILNPRTVIGGQASTGTVVLNNPAAVGGRVVTLSSNNTGAATVPPSVTVPAGQISNTFTVQTSSVNSIQSAVISATAGGVTRRDTLTVSPISLASFSLSSGGVLGGDSVTATVTLNTQAGSGGKLITLTNSNAAVATVPTGVLVPEGFQSKTFTIYSVPVETFDSTIITASAGGVVKSKTLTILAFPTIGMVKDTVIGGNITTLIASLSVPAPAGGVLIELQSSFDSIAHPLSPGGIGEGQTQVSFPVFTHGVGTEVSVTISATNARLPRTASFYVIPAHLSSFTSLPDKGCVAGEQSGFTKKFIAGKPILLKTSLDGEAPPAGALVRYSSDKPGVLAIPDSMNIPYRDWEHSFAVISPAAVTSPEQVILTAAYRSKTLHDTITIIPAPHYTFVDLGEIGDSTSRAIAINNSGKILGASNDETMERPFLWVNGVRTLLTFPPGLVNPDAKGMNDSDVIVGTAYDNTDNLQRAVVWKKDTTIILPKLPGYVQSIATAINNSGDVVGLSDVNVNGIVIPNEPRATLWRDTTITDLGTLPSDLYGIASDINASQQIVGSSFRLSPSYNVHPTSSFSWQNQQISTVNFGGNEANALNDSGEIAGNYTDETGWYTYSTVDDERTDFNNLPPFYQTKAQDINSSGIVVGKTWMYDEETFSHAFIYISGFLYDLNCLTTLPPGYVLKSAVSINNAGQIVGVGRIAAGWFRERAFLLNPVGGVTNVHDHHGHDRPLPTLYALNQNYPNPFNPSTTIGYELPNRSVVSLKIYNVVGQLVATLTDGIEDPGYKHVKFNAHSLSSGVYFYRLEATSLEKTGASISQMRKLLLIK